MKLAIVNDSKLAVEALRRIVGTAGHEVIWVAGDGIEAIELCVRQRPDLVLMDMRMPKLDGVECTRRIMQVAPCPIIVVTSTVEGAYDKVYEAMSLGALDATDTPSPTHPDSIDRLLRKIETVGKLLQAPKRVQLPRLGTAQSPVPQPPLIAIGASTGGPRALVDVLSALGPSFPAAVVIAQHVDVQFAAGLAGWLHSQSGWRVETAVPGARPAVGTALLAATEHHMVIAGDGVVSYSARPLDLPYRPSADVLFRSLRSWKARAAAVLLTGMGRDGASGMLELREAGWLTIAQDKATSVVYGMPRAAAELDAAVSILPIHAIAPALSTYFRTPMK